MARSYLVRRHFRNLFFLIAKRRNPCNSLYDGEKLGVKFPYMGGVESSLITKLLEESRLINISAKPMVEIGRLKREAMPLYHKTYMKFFE